METWTLKFAQADLKWIRKRGEKYNRTTEGETVRHCERRPNNTERARRGARSAKSINKNTEKKIEKR